MSSMCVLCDFIDLGSTEPPTQWVLGDLFLGVKQLGPEADHSLPTSAKVMSS